MTGRSAPTWALLAVSGQLALIALAVGLAMLGGVGVTLVTGDEEVRA